MATIPKVVDFHRALEIILKSLTKIKCSSWEVVGKIVINLVYSFLKTI